jgi:hypothetical protein
MARGRRDGKGTVSAPPLQRRDTTPDPTTNICWVEADLRSAYITLSGTGRLVSMDWPRPE